MISLLIFILILSILIVVHEFGHFWAAKRIGIKVEKFALGFGPKLFSFKKNDTEYLVCAIPLGGYTKLAGDNWEEFRGNKWEYLSRGPGQKAQVVFMGPFLNYILALICFWLVFLIGYPTLSTKVGTVVDDFPAKKAGVLVGDRITAINDKKIKSWEELQKLIHEKKQGPIILSILREDKSLDISVDVRSEKVANILGQKKPVGLIGIRPADEVFIVKYNPIESFSIGFKRLIDLTALTYKAIWRLVTGAMSVQESVTGPLGIFYITSRAAHFGFGALLHVIAVLNVSLAIFNLLPLPVMDGGHLVLFVIERIRGRRLGQKFDEIITKIGISLLIFLATFIFLNDLIKFGIFDKIFKWWLKV
ncbi:MAG: RIP metalloprotease RseP [Candidatus Omnitrophota bacterium]